MITPGTKPVLFHLTKSTKEDLLSRKVKWNLPGLSEFTFYRTYSRKKEDGSLETWNDCVIRVIEGMFSILKTHAKMNHIPWDEKKGQRLAAEAADRMFQFKWTPPGRGLWMMGTDFIWEKSAGALLNCAFVSTERMGENEEETVMPFRFLMDFSMLGAGVGYDTKGANKVTIVGYDVSQTETFMVEDNREGWVDYIALVIRNCIYGGPCIQADVSKVRPKGLPIRGFGGTSSGPQPLLECARGIEQILNEKKGNLISSVDITDIMNLIGRCVVAGNVRRSSEIAFADEDDLEFQQMKNWEIAPVETGSVPPNELKNECPEDYQRYLDHMGTPYDGVVEEIVKKYADRKWAWKFGGWRWNSNNSIFARVGMDYRRYEKSIATAGEPGFAWLDLMRGYGRMKDGLNNKDQKAKGGNPCLEQTLESYEMCCLVENYPSHHKDYWDFQRSLKFSYLYAKAVTLMSTHWERTNAVMIRNRRIGCSMSGVVDAINKFGRTRFYREFCDRGYEYLNYVDRKYSEWLGVPESIKKTSIKPSGTCALVAGVFGSGLHHPKMRSGYRLVRVANNSEFLPKLKRANYRIEAAITDPNNTSVVYFPWLTPENFLSEDDITIWEQFKMAADLQYWWADNQTSCTVGFTRDEAARGEIARCLEAFEGQIKGISLLPKSETGYRQMPYTKAPREEIEAYMATLMPVDFSALSAEGENVSTTLYCEGDSCQLTR